MGRRRPAPASGAQYSERRTVGSLSRRCVCMFKDSVLEVLPVVMSEGTEWD